MTARTKKLEEIYANLWGSYNLPSQLSMSIQLF